MREKKSKRGPSALRGLISVYKLRVRRNVDDVVSLVAVRLRRQGGHVRVNSELPSRFRRAAGGLHKTNGLIFFDFLFDKKTKMGN